MVGGSQDYVRGGAAPAHLFEWGGYNQAGTTFEWATAAWWGDDPIHQIFIDNGVDAFFHGHDHQYAYEMLTKSSIRRSPQPVLHKASVSTKPASRCAIEALSGPGHLRVTVTPSLATVDYVATTTGAVTYSYTIEGQTGAGTLGDVDGNGAANSTDALIILSCDVGLDTSSYCPINCGDANGDGAVNSSDALVILTYDTGASVPFSVGESGCPASVTPCAGCAP